MSDLIVEVCRIDSVRTHPNADRLDLVQIKGFQCITGRDEYKKNDVVVLVPDGAVLPESLIDEFNIEYLRNHHGRVGTIKLRGEYSEGLVLPNKWKFPNGARVDEALKITKWEPKASVYGTTRRGRAIKEKSFKRYTKITNVKHYRKPFVFGEIVWITEKIHGTNFRAGRVPRKCNVVQAWFERVFLHKTHEFVFGSRSLRLDPNAETYYGKNPYYDTCTKYDLKEIIPEGYILYGEIYGRTSTGKKIQDLSYGCDGINVRFFDVYDIKNEGYMDYAEFIPFMKDLGLPIVPILYHGPWDYNLITKYTNTMSVLDEYTLREGIVVRPEQERRQRGARLVLKGISQTYLTRKKGTERH